MSEAYTRSGVNIEAGNRTVDLIRDAAASTFSSAVLTGVGSFGAFYELTDLLREYREPVLVQSVDGVGTKTVVARRAGDFSAIGADLVAACCNDIAVHGARPLTFLDYVANDVLVPEEVAEIVRGIARACRAAGVALIGGETAEMPGVYLPGEHDLVGVVTGVVEKARIVNGDAIRPGDVLFGIASSGLHTNGYSLARRIIEDRGLSLDTVLDDGRSLKRALLAPHRDYTAGIGMLLDSGLTVNGMAHITGGGVVENVPRILPEGCDAVIDRDSWPIPPIFSFFAREGKLDPAEMYQVFNMGIGLVVVVPAKETEDARRVLEASFPEGAFEIGRVRSSSGDQPVGRVQLCE